MKQHLKGISEILLIPLWARSLETNHPNPIIQDVNAVEMMEKVDYDFSKFDNEWPTQLSITIRTETFK